MSRFLVMSLFHMYTGIPCFIVLHCTALHRCCIFNNLMAIPSTSIKTMTRFIVVLALLRWSGTKPAISPRHACMHDRLLFLWRTLIQKVETLASSFSNYWNPYAAVPAPLGSLLDMNTLLSPSHTYQIRNSGAGPSSLWFQQPSA